VHIFCLSSEIFCLRIFNKNVTEMSDKNSKNTVDKKRRGALKAAGTGAAGIVTAASLPSQWKNPILDCIVLPAHAQMSPGTGTDGGGDTGGGAATTVAVSTTQENTTTNTVAPTTSNTSTMTFPTTIAPTTTMV
jgi:hypothetical protein